MGEGETLASFTLRTVTSTDAAGLFAIHRAAMRDYVIATWGDWDEDWQAAYFRDHFPVDRQVIEVGTITAGFLDVHQQADCFFVANIELAPAYQRQGIGHAILSAVLEQATRQGLPVALQVLKVNPARRLYERLGFRLTGETATHFQMQTGG